MPSLCKVVLAIALIAPVLASSHEHEAKSPSIQSTFFPHDGKLGKNPMNGHKHGRHHKLVQKVKKLEQEVETLRQTVFDMEHYFAGFSHAISLEGHKHGQHFIKHHHKHRPATHVGRDDESFEERDFETMEGSLEDLE